MEDVAKPMLHRSQSSIYDKTPMMRRQDSIILKKSDVLTLRRTSSAKPVLHRRATQKFNAWASTDNLLFGGFDHFERMGNTVDGTFVSSRGVFATPSILDEKMRKQHSQLDTHDPYKNPKDINCRAPAFHADKSAITSRNFKTRHNPTSARGLQQQYAKNTGSLHYTKKHDLKMQYSTKTLKLLEFEKKRVHDQVSLLWKDVSHMKHSASEGHLRHNRPHTTTASALARTTTHSIRALSPIGRAKLIGTPTTPNRSVTLEGHTSSSTKTLGRTESNFSTPFSSIGKDVDLRSGQLENLTRTFATRNTAEPERGFNALPAQGLADKNALPTSKFVVIPNEISLYGLTVGQKYSFPVKVRNIGKRTDRFRLGGINAASDSIPATVASCEFDRNKVVLAPGLHLELTVVVEFSTAGEIEGNLRIETRAGNISVNIVGGVE